MPVESFTFVSSLNSSNPAASDDTVQGDDHIRGIKAALLASFPSISGAMTATHTQLNAAVTGNSPGNIPIGGTIIWWSDTLPDPATTGSTWLWCNGAAFSAVTYAALNTVLGAATAPDLRENVPVGKSTMGSTTAAGRMSNYTLTALRTMFGFQSHTLTTAQMPQHSHVLSSNGSAASGGGHTPTGSIVAGGAHNHGGTVSGESAHDHTGTTQGPGQFHTHAYTRYSGITNLFIPNNDGNGQLADVWHGTSSQSTGNDPGTHTHDFGTNATDSHTHTITSADDHTHTLSMNAVAEHTHTLAGTTDNAGSTNAHNIVQPGIVCNWIIRAL